MNAAENHCIIGYHTNSSLSHIHPVVIRLDLAGHPVFQETPKTSRRAPVRSWPTLTTTRM